jgi:hypothetical protein
VGTSSWPVTSQMHRVRYLWYLNSVRKNRSDCTNNPSSGISFMSSIVSTSGRLHSDFVCLLFLHTHRETDHFFASSGVQCPYSTSDQFHYRLTVFSQFRSRIGSIFTKDTTLRITLSIDGTPIESRSHSRRLSDVGGWVVGDVMCVSRFSVRVCVFRCLVSGLL